ncbi:unnamed protein product [Chrysodeixis includens]|uniref:Uncharacterized protein n=1 Tax=Chrysodeixis includens TaxID=689277 RepID=A0A9P0BSI3_CHRIL|nr:unnamed protein product [Chrysodeixis includens]
MNLNFCEIFFNSGTVLSILCVIIMLLAWCIIPQWRTLQNYISLNQILCGTIQMCFINFQPFYHYDLYWDVILSYYFMRIMIVWSLCSSLLAYLRLVFVYNGKISNGKTKATIFVLYVFFVMTAIEQWLVGNLLTPNFNENGLSLLTIYLVVMSNSIVFIRIVLSVMSCCKKSVSKRNFSHVLSLVGVAVICDSVLVVQLIFVTVFSSSDSMSCAALFFYTHRLVFQSMFVLLRKSSMTHMQLFVRKLRNRRSNNILLRTRFNF